MINICQIYLIFILTVKSLQFYTWVYEGALGLRTFCIKLMADNLDMAMAILVIMFFTVLIYNLLVIIINFPKITLCDLICPLSERKKR